MAHSGRGAIRTTGALTVRGPQHTDLSAAARAAALAALAVAGQLPAQAELRRQRPMGIPVELGADVEASHGPAAEVFRLWRSYLARRPALSLRDVGSRREGRGDPAFYPLGAVLCQMAFERGGVGAVKRLLRAGPTDDDLLRTLSSVLALAPTAVDAAWRAYVLGSAPD